jgi:branched-chain amino acid transport system substrate-binding protein
VRRSLAISGCAIGALALGVSACGDDGGGGGGGGTVSGSTLTIYSSFPLTGASSGQTKSMVNGIKLALKQAGNKVGQFTLKYKSLDDSLASTGAADPGQGAQNARKAVQDKTTIAFLGAYNSGISKVEIPILNKSGILQVSPANTYVGLTSTRPGHEPGEPDKYYKTGKRNYARVVPADNIQGAALVTAAKEAGCKSVHIWNSKTTYSAGLARNVSISAKEAGLTVEGNDGIDIKAPNYRSLAARIKADCFIFTGEVENNGTAAIKDVASARPSIKLYGGDAVCLNDIADPKKGLPAATGARFKCTIATLDPATFSEAGKKFFADYRSEYNLQNNPDPYAIYGYEAAQLVLDAIKRAGDKGNDRQAVIDEVFNTKNRDSVLGTYSIDENGDTTLTDYGMYKVSNGKLVFDRVLKAG